MPEIETGGRENDQEGNVQGSEIIENKLDHHDSAIWPTHNMKHITEFLVQTGPKQVEFIEFPRDQHNRRFSKVHYKRRLANGEEVHCPWLMYSGSKNATSCFCCKLFETI